MPLTWATAKPRPRDLGPSDRPVTDAQGNPRLSFSGTGPVLERLFTGTAFVATEDGLLLTNAHVAVPWQFEEPAEALVQRGLIPVMQRQIGYLPGIEAPFDVELVVASETADVAVLRCSGATGLVPFLPLGETPARPGEEVFVPGYPTGIRALLARTNEAFVDSLMRDPRPDFWTMAQRLSEAGHIAPLATRGIVGQATLDKLVYDAETTHGGSGGPVLGLNGEVQAINAAILTDFGGSNLGIPAAHARRDLACRSRLAVETNAQRWRPRLGSLRRRGFGVGQFVNFLAVPTPGKPAIVSIKLGLKIHSQPPVN